MTDRHPHTPTEFQPADVSPEETALQSPASPEHPPTHDDRPAIPDRDKLSDGHIDLGEGGWNGSREWRGFVRLYLGTALVALLLAIGTNLLVDPYGVTGAGIWPPRAQEGSDRTTKARTLLELDGVPQVLLLGSSTTRNADPDDVRAITGAEAFNASVSAGRPIDAYAFAAVAAEKAEETGEEFPHVVYFVDVDVTFFDTPPDATLATSPTLRRQFPARDAGQLWLTALKPYATLETLQMSVRSVLAGRERQGEGRQPGPAVRRDGYRLRDPYGQKQFEKRLQNGSERYRALIYGSERYRSLDERPSRYVRQLIELANEHGDRPTIVVLAPHPEYRELVEDHGWTERRQRVLQWLRSQEGATVVDLTDLATFGGDVQAFSDHVHMTEENMRRIAEELHERGLLTDGEPS